ncbi:MAG: hypothetical protein WDN02_11955 [Methylovirgula sp.]|uniref:hypothetical protein n=1 Tax=Methylovirgula sp. TaxID=1978224 RepID=UPI0030764730
MRDEVQQPQKPGPEPAQKPKETQPHEPPHAKRPRHLGLVAICALLALAGLVIFGAWGHAQRQAAAADTQKQQEETVPIVRVARVASTDAPRVLDLPRQHRGLRRRHSLCARDRLYLEAQCRYRQRSEGGRRARIIAAPDLDQQLLQAEAQVSQLEAAIAQAQSNSQLAKVTNQRTQTLVVQGWQTKQQGDNDRLTSQAQSAAVRVAVANLQAGQAQVSRLKELTGFEKIVAPFDGFITQRHIDVGSSSPRINRRVRHFRHRP